MSLSVSVIIPSYNRADDVQRAVRSALLQSHTPLEILVVDDGSTDRTAEVVRAMSAPVRYLPKPNGGVSSARNLGMREARGDVFALLDSDDQWAPDWLGLAVAALEAHPEAAAVCAKKGLDVTLVEAAPRAGQLQVLVDPWAEVYVDGQWVETTPFARPLRVRPGRRFVELRNPHYPPVRQVVDILPEHLQSLRFILGEPAGGVGEGSRRAVKEAAP